VTDCLSWNDPSAPTTGPCCVKMNPNAVPAAFVVRNQTRPKPISIVYADVFVNAEAEIKYVPTRCPSSKRRGALDCSGFFAYGGIACETYVCPSKASRIAGIRSVVSCDLVT